MTCLFCDIAGGSAPSHTIWEDNLHVAFLSIFPNTLGFTVVATKNHYSSYGFEQEDTTLSQLILASKRVGLLLDESFPDVARTGLILEGFGVDHLHAKLFPMHGTAPMAEWRPILSSGGEFFERYEGYISSRDFRRAEEQELAALAAHIRAVASR